MAESPAHKFGQVIGNVVEAAIEPLLEEFTAEHNLYLDTHGPRAARSGRKLTWRDMYGNTHDLDFVLERGGTETQRGTPVAFIESAWRRYTKHSRNKAQEIEGAISPLMDTFKNDAPFAGAVLAGVFTDGAIAQLNSKGFHILYFPYETVVEAFASVGIDASFEEDTAIAEFSTKVEQWEALTQDQRNNIASSLVEINEDEISRFLSDLALTVNRRIVSVRILPLHGTPLDVATVPEAISIIEDYHEEEPHAAFQRYEIRIEYSNSDLINGSFNTKGNAIVFLNTFIPD